MSISIRVDDGRILLEAGEGAACQSRVERVPERSWDRDLNAWSFPATPESARQVREAFRGFGSARVSKSFQQLLVVNDPPPVELKTPLWPHQREAVAFVTPLNGAMLAHDMGAGKTLTAIATILARRHQRILILCPSRVVTTWADQFAMHAGDAVRALPLNKGVVKKRTERAEQAYQDTRSEPLAIIINYEAARSGSFQKWVLKQSWDLVILDESHRVKAPGGTTSRFVTALGRRAAFRLCLSGTPMPHSPLDIYAQFRFLDSTIFGTSFAAFKARYAILRQAPWGTEVVRYQREPELHEKIYRITHRVETKDVLDLPETQDIVVPVELSGVAWRTYRELEAEFYSQIDGDEITAANALTKLLRLQQITSGYVVLDEGKTERSLHDGKRLALADLLTDLPQREPVVVFARFSRDLEVIRDVCKWAGRRYGEISGKTNEDDYRAFAAGDLDVIGVQIQAGGEGLNDLVRARYCVYYSLGFSLGEYRQSRARLHRPGQRRNVIYYHLVARNTIDETVYRALEQRQNVIETVLSKKGTAS